MEHQVDAPTPPAKRNRNLFVGVGGCFLLLSVLLNAFLLLALMGAAATGAGLGGGLGEYQEIHVDGEETATAKIVVLPIEGLIMDLPGTPNGMVTQVRQMLKMVRDDENVKALILSIDSPGGGVTASDKIYHELKNFRAEKDLPVVAIFGDVAASGGYYVAMTADHIVSHPTTLTGSIGVISNFVNFAELMDTVGVKVNTVKSLTNQGQESYKDMGSPYRPMTEKERLLFQTIITEMWQRFTQVVAEGREGKLTLEQVQKLADGRVFTGTQALELKLVDSVGYREDAYRIARELAQAGDARVVRYKRIPTFADMFSLASSTEPPGALELLRSFTERSPRLLYLWTAI